MGRGRKRGKRKEMVGRPKKEKEGEKELHSNGRRTIKQCNIA
jgi:hypothetical protein